MSVNSVNIDKLTTCCSLSRYTGYIVLRSRLSWSDLDKYHCLDKSKLVTQQMEVIRIVCNTDNVAHTN